MIEALRAQWQDGLSFEALIKLRDEQDAILQRLRAERDIHSPNIRCKQCKYRGEAPPPHVSVRAMILSVHRFGIAPAEPIHALEKGWSAYRKENGLDLYGKTPDPAALPTCTHGQAR